MLYNITNWMMWNIVNVSPGDCGSRQDLYITHIVINQSGGVRFRHEMTVQLSVPLYVCVYRGSLIMYAPSHMSVYMVVCVCMCCITPTV